jgi:hypothetical protein
MVTDAYAPPSRRRRLLQPLEDGGVFLDSDTTAALAGAGVPKAPPLPVKTAKLLVSPQQAAVIECPAVAYPTLGASTNSTVGVKLLTSIPPAAAAGNDTRAAASANALGGSKLSLTFPYFETLYYDPIIYFGDIDGMGLADVPAPPHGGCAGVVCGRVPERRINGSPARRARGALAGALAGAAALFAGALL